MFIDTVQNGSARVHGSNARRIVDMIEGAWSTVGKSGKRQVQQQSPQQRSQQAAREQKHERKQHISFEHTNTFTHLVDDDGVSDGTCSGEDIMPLSVSVTPELNTSKSKGVLQKSVSPHGHLRLHHPTTVLRQNQHLSIMHK